MNNHVRHASDAVSQLHTLVARLASAPVTTQTRMVQVEDDSRDFVEKSNVAVTAIEQAMDEVDGPALTALDSALDSLRRARAAFYTPVDDNRANTLTFVTQARNYVQSATRRV